MDKCWGAKEVIIALCALAFVMSILYLISAQQDFERSKFCTLFSKNGTTEGCKDVYASGYSKTFGFPNAYLGILGFGALLVALILERRKTMEELRVIIGLGMGFSFLFAVWFLYLQLHVIKALCGYCMIIDMMVVLMVGVYGYTTIKKC